MNKAALMESLLTQLRNEFETLASASKAAHEAATHEENKAEDQYDTRGIEASYLAGAQSQRAAEIEKSIRVLGQFVLKDFADGEPVRVGALVEMQVLKKKSYYFFLPAGAGTMLDYDGMSVLVVTPASQLGQELTDKYAGDSFVITGKGQEREYTILSVR